jgi:hypothetical protein
MARMPFRTLLAPFGENFLWDGGIIRSVTP